MNSAAKHLNQPVTLALADVGTLLFYFNLAAFVLPLR
jgi:hypothetical protein